MAAQPELRERAPRLPPRIGAKKGLTLAAAEKAVTGPFEERLSAFLDLLYSDVRRAGVTGHAHAQVLFRWWLELSQTYDHETGGAFAAYFSALAAFYPAPGTLRFSPSEGESFTRPQAERAMRAPFESLLKAYLKRLDDPMRSPGIKDDVHARETFITFCRLVGRFEPHRTRGRK